MALLTKIASASIASMCRPNANADGNPVGASAIRDFFRQPKSLHPPDDPPWRRLPYRGDFGHQKNRSRVLRVGSDEIPCDAKLRLAEKRQINPEVAHRSNSSAA